MQIAGSSVLVTGASGGLGSHMVRELAGQGARVVISARNVSLLDQLAAETGAEVLVADLTKRDDVDRLAERAASCDVLVLNAGVGHDPALEELTAERIDQSLDVNLRSPMVLANAYAQARIAAGAPGQIVLIGSLSGMAATEGTRLYNATKFGLRGFALSFRQDLEGTGVGCTHIAPGFIRDAGMFADGDMDVPGIVRTKSPADVAAAVVRAITDDPAEIFVSPVELRAASTFATLAPALSARIQRRIGIRGRRAT